MIAADQPSIFKDGVVARVSSVDDGNMKHLPGSNDSTVAERNYAAFLKTIAATPADATFMTLTQEDYNEGTDFTRYRTVTDVDKGNGPGSPLVGVDGISTTRPGHVLAIPPGDCPVAILYDPVHRALMLSHLGRHSVEQFGARESVVFMGATYASDPAALLVWISPLPNGDAYPLWAFDNRSMAEVIAEQLAAAGVAPSNTEISAVDTITNQAYFSHSEFLKGHRTQDGRYVVVAALV